ISFKISLLIFTISLLDLIMYISSGFDEETQMFPLLSSYNGPKYTPLISWIFSNLTLSNFKSPDFEVPINLLFDFFSTKMLFKSFSEILEFSVEYSSKIVWALIFMLKKIKTKKKVCFI